MDISRIAEMRSFTQDLTHSREERMAVLAGLEAEVQDMRRDTRQVLSEHRAERMAWAANLHQGLAEDKANRNSSVNNALAQFGRIRTEMASGQSAALAKVRADRQSEVQTLRGQAQTAMREIGAVRLAGEAALRSKLRQGRLDLSQEVGQLVDGIHRTRMAMATEQREGLNRNRVQLLTDTTKFLGESRKARSEMAQAQGESLQTGRAARRGEVLATNRRFRDAREALVEDFAQCRQVWREFADTTQERRLGVSIVEATPNAEVQPVPPPVIAEQVTHVAETPVEAPIQPSHEVIFRYLADHPDGVRLVEIESHFGIPRIRLVPIITRLIEENKARKDEDHKLYFAT